MPVGSRRTLPLTALLVALGLSIALWTSPVTAAVAPNVASTSGAKAPEPDVRRARLTEAPIVGLPADMTDPEGRTRWDLSVIRSGSTVTTHDTSPERGALPRLVWSTMPSARCTRGA